MSIGQWPSRGLLAPWSSLGEMGAIFFASSVVHLLLLVPTLVTLQVYDRVLSSRRSETLLMLLAAAALALLAWWSVETSREHWHSAGSLVQCPGPAS